MWLKWTIKSNTDLTEFQLVISNEMDILRQTECLIVLYNETF